MSYGGCGTARLVEPFSTDSQLVLDALPGLSPGGGTPLAASTEQAVAYVRSAARGTKKRNLVMLTDGGESCSGNPVEAAKTVLTIQRNTVP